MWLYLGELLLVPALLSLAVGALLCATARPPTDVASRRELRACAALASLAVFVLLMGAIWLRA